MNSVPFVLLALALGIVIGAGLTVMIVLAMRARNQVQESIAAELPKGLVAVLDGMDDAACAVDSSGLIVAVSEPAAQYGFTVGKTIENTELRDLVRAVRSSGHSQSLALRLNRPEGASVESRLVSARASTAGARLHLLIVRDVTEQERLEQMRYDFVANTSHELKTPVGAVTLLAEAIESAADDEDQVRIFAGRLQAEATRLAHVTRRIMSLSRLQSADGAATLQPVSIDEVITAAVESHHVQADAAGVDLSRGGDRGATVRGDNQILTDAIGNLIANAIAYSPRGSRVGVGVRIDGDAVEIAVTDQGIGISAEDKERIFERFYRADEARSRRTGGTGLGLAIVKHATLRHGGQVRVWSQPGRGSTFTMRLPLWVNEPEKSSSGKNKKKRGQERRRKAGVSE
ncbi:sensor histidine kinase [Microbacterium sp. YY-01]|uniref:sensor histidine kinase n=1 Tax=Microbacterium sp. YY-01 TaxID=3421634 RepID=UPI003D16DEDC